MPSQTKDALDYHSLGRPGKTEIRPTKSCHTAADLSLAYSPGVAHPVLEIARDPDLAFSYTNRGNLVAVISNGSAILGLGDRGALASKPVMEGKAVLFKRFADVDVFDLELDTHDPLEFIQAVKLLAPTFGGINLEDIASPDCFEIEQRLIDALDIPVFHDDQHGTAIIATAGLLNAAEIAGKRLEDLRVVFAGAGAAGISCARMFIEAGVQAENLLMTDRRGVIFKGREESMTPEKREFAVDTDRRTLTEAIEGADVFAGLSVGHTVTKQMVASMAESPIVFAMANPTPEISWEDAHEARPDVIMATGRSDYPNQVNNVLGFPYIFRGALDVRARHISEGMKMAAARALAALAREEVPESVAIAYGGEEFSFGPRYIVPKPFDPRVIEWVSPAVAREAVAEGLHRVEIPDLEEYRIALRSRMRKYWK
jgi:malate dehydrogenase (oxaloacetate-decarboxylating)(NADP+)